MGKFSKISCGMDYYSRPYSIPLVAPYWQPSVSPEKVMTVSYKLRAWMFLSWGRGDITFWFVLLATRSLACFFRKSLFFRFVQIFNSWYFFCGHYETRTEDSWFLDWNLTQCRTHGFFGYTVAGIYLSSFTSVRFWTKIELLNVKKCMWESPGSVSSTTGSW